LTTVAVFNDIFTYSFTSRNLSYLILDIKDHYHLFLTLSLIGIILLVLLQQELDTKLQSWKTKQQEVVAKLSILHKNKNWSTQKKSRIILPSINRMPTKM